jgi:hypothetical protein
MDGLHVIFNRCEAALWLLISAAIAVHAVACRARGALVARHQSIAALAFAVFGVSDIIECYTGAWWRPWWLLVLKASCVVALILCYIAHKQAVASSRSTREPSRDK